MTKAPVRLAPAYSWQCPCGAKNWEELMGPEWTDEQKAEIADLAVLHPVVAGVLEEWRIPPVSVRCRSCGEAFAAEGG